MLLESCNIDPFFKQPEILNVNSSRSHQKEITRKMFQELLLELTYLRNFITITSKVVDMSSSEQ